MPTDRYSNHHSFETICDIAALSLEAMPTMHLSLTAGHLKVVDRVLLHFTIFETGQNLKAHVQ
jgi:hypothetical protein